QRAGACAQAPLTRDAGSLVSSLAHPDGNLTGFTGFEYAMGGKWLELLKEIAPSVMRILVLAGTGSQVAAQADGFSVVIEAAASQHRTQFKGADLSTAADIERAFDVFAREPNGGLILVPTPIATVHLEVNDSNSCGAAEVIVSSPRARRSTPRPCASR